MASELKVNKISPESGTTLTLGDSGDTINFGSGVLPNFENLTVTGDLTVDTNSLKVDSTNNFVGIGTATPSVALDVVGAITASGNITGTLATAAQPNITSVGTLSSATISGDLTIGTNHTIGDDANLNLELTSATNEDIVLASARNVQADLDHNSAGGTRTFSVTSQGLTKTHLLVNTGGDISFYEDTGTTAKFFWDASAENLGIGTTSPVAPIDALTNSTVYAGRFIQSNTTNGDGLLVQIGSTASSDYALTVRSDGGNTSGLAVKADGLVGIGTFSPSYTLQVDHQGAENVTIVAKGTAPGFGLYDTTASAYNWALYNSNGELAFYNTLNTNGFNSLSEKMRITTAGNIGIGTSTPSRKLTVTGGEVEIRDGNYFMMRPSGNAWDMRLQAVSTRLDVVSGGDTANPIATFVHGGNVGIGDTSPDALLSIKGNSDAGTTPTIRLKDGTDTREAFISNSSGDLILATASSSDNVIDSAITIYSSQIVFNTSGTTRLILDSSGHWLPDSTNTYDLGSSTKVWRNIYTSDFHMSNEGLDKGNDIDGTKGSWTFQEGENDLFLINNKNGKKYKFNLTEVA